MSEELEEKTRHEIEQEVYDLLGVDAEAGRWYQKNEDLRAVARKLSKLQERAEDDQR
jgi:hypothetical protein